MADDKWTMTDEAYELEARPYEPYEDDEAWVDKACEAYESYKANWTNRTNEVNKSCGANRKPLEPQPFLPKKGNYRDLLVYQKAECLYDITFYFAHHYFQERKDRTIDQLVQAARSAKQNIAEGCAAASTSAETEIKLIGVARASMKEVLEDYIDYLRTRGLEQWSKDNARTRQIQEYSKKHNRPEDYTADIEKRSPETICNIAITLIYQYDVMMGRLLDRLQKDFVEKGGIREQMTAARLSYRNDQKSRIAELEAENSSLKARIAELEQKLKNLIGLIGPIGLMGLIRQIRLIGLIGLIGLMGPMSLMSCSGDSDEPTIDLPTIPVQTKTPISFSGSESKEEAVTKAAGNPLSYTRTRFTVWGYKNMSFAADVYGSTQTVFPQYIVDYQANSASTTTTNSSNWDYILLGYSGQSIKYWDFSAKAYRFFAVTGTKWEDGDFTSGQYKTNGTIESSDPYEITLCADASSEIAMSSTQYFSRLWFSTGNVEDYPDKQFGKPVTLEFVKPYARARFIFKYSEPREGIKLSEVSFKPSDDSKIARKGTVTVHYPKEGTAIKEWYSMEVNSDPDPEVNKALTALTEDYDPEDDGKTYTESDKGWYMVLPNNEQGSYTLSVTVNGQEKTAVVPANYMQWLPGYSYTYIFKIIDQGGVEIGWVEYAVTSWSEMEADHMVYNW